MTIPHGYALVESVFTPAEVADLIAELPDLDGVAGTRSLLRYPVGIRCASDARVRDLVAKCIGPGARPVRGILFDKQPGSNWVLGWHQDTKIAVKERVDAEGYTSWSVKEGVVHCQPPAELLDRCVAVRLHLDDCDKNNGALRVIPNSHTHGFCDRFDETQEVTLTCQAGDVVLMKPLLQHASSKAVSPNHRRVIHIEFCAGALADGMTWTEPWPPDNVTA